MANKTSQQLKEEISNLHGKLEQLEQLNSIIELSPVMVFVWKAAEDWPVEFASGNIAQFGYTPEDFYSGRISYSSIVHPDDVAQMSEEVLRYSQDPECTSFRQKYRILTADGRVCWTDDRSWIRRDAEGNITHYQGIVWDVTARTVAETALREKVDIIESQRYALQALSTPIIPIMDQIIVMPLIGGVDSMRAKDIMRTLLSGIREHHAKVVILDVTGVPVVDTGVVNYLNKTVQAARLKGARTIITGISDAVAESIVDLGIDWSKIETLRDLQSGLLVALKSLGLKLQR